MLESGPHCPKLVAIRAKRTSREHRECLDLTKMTHSGHKPGRNPAAQQSPAVLRCAISLSEAREASGSETARRHRAHRRRGRGVVACGARAAADRMAVLIRAPCRPAAAP